MSIANRIEIEELQLPEGAALTAMQGIESPLAEIDLRCDQVVDLRGGQGEEALTSLAAQTRRSRFATPHRIASYGLAAVTLGALAVAALIWSVLFGGRWTILGTAGALITFATLFMNGYFRVNMAEARWMKLPLVASAATFGVVAALFTVSGVGLDEPGSRAFILLMVALTISAALSRVVGRGGLEALWRAGHLRSSALVLGYDDLSQELAAEVGIRPALGVDIVGLVTDAPVPRTRSSLPLPVLRIDGSNRAELDRQLGRAVEATGADRFIIGPLGSVDDGVAMAAARWAASRGMPVHVVPRFHQMGMGLDSMSPDRARGYPLVRLQRSAHPTLSLRLKRLLDITIAGGVLMLAAPIMVLAAVAVKLSSPGAVLYSQERVGQGGTIILVRKFRSMTEDGDGTSEWTSDGRITWVGRWLRRTNIDELPQLFAVLRGDMSMVGPRPERPAFVERFRVAIPDYDDRHRMPVGLTGLAQVVGLRGDTSITERVKYDNLYIDQWSLRADLSILAQTFAAILWQHRRSRQMAALEKTMRALWR